MRARPEFTKKMDWEMFIGCVTRLLGMNLGTTCSHHARLNNTKVFRYNGNVFNCDARGNLEIEWVEENLYVDEKLWDLIKFSLTLSCS